MTYVEPRRQAPRISTEALCGVVAGRGLPLRHATMVDLSWLGLRIELPFDHRTAGRAVQLELELPQLDEIVWARGHVTFAQLTPMGGFHADGQPRLWCSAGVHLDVVAPSERDLLRDVVMETRRAHLIEDSAPAASPRARTRRRRWQRLRS
jgi:hypothetical protein